MTSKRTAIVIEGNNNLCKLMPEDSRASSSLLKANLRIHNNTPKNIANGMTNVKYCGIKFPSILQTTSIGPPWLITKSKSDSIFSSNKSNADIPRVANNGKTVLRNMYKSIFLSINCHSGLFWPCFLCLAHLRLSNDNCFIMNEILAK